MSVRACVPPQNQFTEFMASCERMDMSEGLGMGPRGGVAMNHRDLLKAKLQKDKYMTKPLSEIVATETEVRSKELGICQHAPH